MKEGIYIFTYVDTDYLWNDAQENSNFIGRGGWKAGSLENRDRKEMSR